MKTNEKLISLWNKYCLEHDMKKNVIHRMEDAMDIIKMIDDDFMRVVVLYPWMRMN